MKYKNLSLVNHIDDSHNINVIQHHNSMTNVKLQDIRNILGESEGESVSIFESPTLYRTRLLTGAIKRKNYTQYR